MIASISDSMDVCGELLDRVMQGSLGDASDLIETLQKRGLSVETLLFDLIEPASRRLRDLWQDDRCNDLEMTYALGRLQALVRQIGSEFEQSFVAVKDQRSVLLATAPGEQHMLSLSLASECFWRAGWDVICLFPKSSAELVQALRERRFDVLDVAISSVFRRDHRLAALASTLHCVRAASSNPSLMIQVSGQLFIDHSEFSVLVGADAAYTGAAKAVPLAECLVVSARASLSLQQVRRQLLDIGKGVAEKAFREGLLVS